MKKWGNSFIAIVSIFMLCMIVIGGTAAYLKYNMIKDINVVRGVHEASSKNKVQINRVDQSYYANLLMVTGKLKGEKQLLQAIREDKILNSGKKANKEFYILELLNFYYLEGVSPIKTTMNELHGSISAKLYHYKDSTFGKCQCDVWEASLKNKLGTVKIKVDANTYELYYLEIKVKNKVSISKGYSEKVRRGLTEEDIKFLLGGALSKYTWSNINDIKIKREINRNRIIEKQGKNTFLIKEIVSHQYKYYVSIAYNRG